ncbi:hypothetical protein N0V93_009836 [Gnomoniopsis smithogilvyi]|uniref:Uncharacterized protein n=1 Tax=Gnomoniopsis smithogilvyi TaxID=1191159 RepID=A0A9W8YHS2_9PEZI|nr:hypothetical protein N0V93_009836 [Gnomoniopsis smithogilvyi]
MKFYLSYRSDASPVLSSIFSAKEAPAHDGIQLVVFGHLAADTLRKDAVQVLWEFYETLDQIRSLIAFDKLVHNGRGARVSTDDSAAVVGELNNKVIQVPYTEAHAKEVCLRGALDACRAEESARMKPPRRELERVTQGRARSDDAAIHSPDPVAAMLRR